MGETFSRTITLERKEGAPLGTLRAILATDGEASDGHILAMKGAQLELGIPLLFGHDAISGRSNLGSWSRFTVKPHEVHGEAQIELDGAGEQREWRADVAHMIAAGHIGSVSVRWEPIGKPIKRTALAPAHAAFVDAERETAWAKLNGYYFPKWRALEGSVVTLGSDKAALIKRSLETSGSVAELWRSCAEELERDEDEPSSDEPVPDEAELEAVPVVKPPSAREPEPAKVARLEDSKAAVAAMFARLAAADEAMRREMRAAAQELLCAAQGKR